MGGFVDWEMWMNYWRGLMFVLRWWRWAFTTPGWVRCRSEETLVVLLHGVHEKWLVWNMVAHALAADLPEACAVWAPYMPAAHVAPLAEAAAGLDTVRQWMRLRPRGRVILVGMSNGGRVAASWEQHLPAERDVRVLTLGSPLNGTARLDSVPAALADWHLTPAVHAEMRAGQGAYPAARAHRYVHFAARHDWMVYSPVRACLKGNGVRVLEHDGHLSMMVSREVRKAICAEIADPGRDVQPAGGDE
jgi:pimeloyl-ACP methyl ester carboxylesterase